MMDLARLYCCNCDREFEVCNSSTLQIFFLYIFFACQGSILLHIFTFLLGFDHTTIFLLHPIIGDMSPLWLYCGVWRCRRWRL